MYEKLIKKIESSYKLFLWEYIKWNKMLLVFLLPKISVKWNEKKIDELQKKLQIVSQKNQWIILNKIQTNKWTIVESIEFKDNNYYLKFIWKLNDFERFCINYELIKSNFPLLLSWCDKNFLKINEYDWKWLDLIKVLKYFLLNNNSNLYIRELPIEVDTKFIENNKTIIDNLLQFIWNEEEILFEWNIFEEKYWLKTKPNFVRVRFLDNLLKQKFLWIEIDDIYLKISDFENIKINCNYIFIVENEINYLTFPNVENAIIIWWKWFNVSILKNTNWLHNKDIYYWWDIDSHGFKILSSFRKYFKNTKSLFMDRQTYDKFRNYEWKWIYLGVEEFNNIKKYLNSEEVKLFDYINKNNLRLEQENISQEYISRGPYSIYDILS